MRVKENLHVDLGAVDLLGDGLDDADDDVLQSLSLGVIVQDEAASLLGVRAAERRRAHAGVDGPEVVMKSIEVLKEEKPLQLNTSWSFYKLHPHTTVKRTDCSPCLTVYKVLAPPRLTQLWNGSTGAC